MPKFLPLQRILLPLIGAALIILNLLSLARAVYLVTHADGAWDFHPYWYYAHFVHQGINPYIAFDQHLTLPDIVHYVDGSEVAPDVLAQQRFAPIPANTASTVLLAALFAYFPWDYAKYLWFALNLTLLVAMPWWVLRLVPRSLQLDNMLRWLAALSFWANKGPRVALSLGQPSILTFSCMILTLLLRERHWLWAGLALGVALGKYSIALPVAFFVLLEGRWRVLLVAGVVQGASLLAVSALDGGSLWGTLLVYWRMMTHYAGGQEGVHLGYLLRDLPAAITLALTVVGTLVTLWAMWRAWQQGFRRADVLPVNSLLALWTLVGAYHRAYDIMLALFFLILILSALTRWELPAPQVRLLGLGWLAMLFVLCLPGEILEGILPAAQAEVEIGMIEAAVTLTLVGMWGVNLWLLSRVPQVDG